MCIVWVGQVSVPLSRVYRFAIDSSGHVRLTHAEEHAFPADRST